MSWNYRVIARRTPQNEWTFGVHEVYYADDGTIDAWSEEPITPFGETLGELRDDIIYQQAAFTKVALTPEDETLVLWRGEDHGDDDEDE
jgi:hypothetical protein